MIDERRRFTIGHELGHFLMVHHKPNDSRFLCTAKDMTRQAIRREQLLPAQRWEVEANEFASLIRRRRGVRRRRLIVIQTWVRLQR
jgi:Zn-dependent peptidase ImmA (M78 family)